jgi:hypothetical protein
MIPLIIEEKGTVFWWAAAAEVTAARLPSQSCSPTGHMLGYTTDVFNRFHLHNIKTLATLRSLLLLTLKSGTYGI